MTETVVGGVMTGTTGVAASGAGGGGSCTKCFPQGGEGTTNGCWEGEQERGELEGQLQLQQQQQL